MKKIIHPLSIFIIEFFIVIVGLLISSGFQDFSLQGIIFTWWILFIYSAPFWATHMMIFYGFRNVGKKMENPIKRSITITHGIYALGLLVIAILNRNNGGELISLDTLKFVVISALIAYGMSFIFGWTYKWAYLGDKTTTNKTFSHA